MSTLTPETPALEAPRRRHTARWLAGGLLVVLVVVSVVMATRPSYEATPVASPLIGQPAPAFSQATLDGSQLALASLRGHYVVLNFFASWCTPCQTEEPALVAFDFEQSRQADRAELVSVVFDDPDSAAAQFVQSWGARWPALTDPGGAVANSYGVSSPPTTFLIDPRGRVVDELLGPVSRAELDAKLAQARSGNG